MMWKLCLWLLAFMLSLCNGQATYQFSQNNTMVLEGGQVTLTIQRTATDEAIQTLLVIMVDGVEDFLGDSQVAVFRPSDMQAEVTFIALDDIVPEPMETFTVTLNSTASGQIIGVPGIVTVSIPENDDAAGIFSFNSSSVAMVAEGGTLSFEVTREAGAYGDVVIQYHVTGTHNDYESDILPLNGSIRFMEGQRSANLSLTAVNDNIPENVEEFLVTLSTVGQGVISNGITQLFIAANDDPVRFAQAIVFVYEGDDDVIVTLDIWRGYLEQGGDLIGSLDQNVSVQYVVKQLNATSGLDYAFPDGVIRFGAGATKMSIQGQVLSDSIPEIEEVFIVEITQVVGDAVLVNPYAVSVVIGGNDDQHGIVKFHHNTPSTIFINEDLNPTVTVVIVRQGGTFGDITVHYNIGARSDLDFINSIGTVIIPDGAVNVTLTLAAVQDADPERSEEFMLALTSVDGGAKLEGAPMRSVIIQDSDDAHGVVQWLSGGSYINSTAAQRRIWWTVERDGGMLGAVVVTFSCVYSIEGNTVEGILVQDDLFHIVIQEGSATASAGIDIAASAYLSIGGIFTATIDEVKLLDETQIASYNSPTRGSRQVDIVTVDAITANGEIGITNISTMFVNEPESGVEQFVIALSREGMNGDAQISWSLSETQMVSIDSSDVLQMSGILTMPSGSGEANILITILADDLSETDEYTTLTLTSVSPNTTQKLRVNFTQVTLVIRENDNPGGMFQIAEESAQPVRKYEGEDITITVERIGAAMVERSIFFSVTPNGDSEFYGSTGILKFNVNETQQTVVILIQNDNIPELDELFIFSIQAQLNTNSAVFSERITKNITIIENDFPFGVVHFQEDATYTLSESKGANRSHLIIPVIRSAGTFSAVNVSVKILPASGSNDLELLQNYVTFDESQSLASLEVSSVSDVIPEDEEEYLLELFSPTNGAVIGTKNTTRVVIVSNDVALYFKEPSMVLVQEGEHAVLTVARLSASKSASVSYRTVNGSASPTDYTPIISSLQFNQGQFEQTINIPTFDDFVPETEEMFTVELYDAIGDVVVYGTPVATVTILPNDNANGIFRFNGPYAVLAEEGEALVLSIQREAGLFGSVTVMWRISQNGSLLGEGVEFMHVSGQVTFSDGIDGMTISLVPIADRIPEYDEVYTIQLYNITAAAEVQFADISLLHDSIQITILINDDPNGVIEFSAGSREHIVMEDYNDNMVNSTRAMFDISRMQGLAGNVEVLWEVYSDQVAGVLPSVKDLLFNADIPDTISRLGTGGRPGMQSPVYQFNGLSELVATVSVEQVPLWMNDDFALSVWVKPDSDCDGVILSKADIRGNTFLSLHITANSQGTPVTITLTLLDSSTRTPLGYSSNWNSESSDINEWKHILINVASGKADFLFQGTFAERKNIPTNREDVANPIIVGADQNGQKQYNGSMQDLRLFARKLTPAEIIETTTHPAKHDVQPVGGIVQFLSDEDSQSVAVQAIQDVEAESNEVFSIKLIDVKGGARISPMDSVAKLTVLKSDYANGLFGFEGPCQPSPISEEGGSYTCTVKRERGDAATVDVMWELQQIHLDGNTSLAVSDFNVSSGILTFSPGQLRNEIYLVTAEDETPELTERFYVVLKSVASSDGEGSTETSGASIDAATGRANISIQENDMPNGLLQFSEVFSNIDDIIRPVKQRPTIRVNEDQGIVSLLVERAQGLIGDVSAEWMTEDGSAQSTSDPRDFVGTAGRIELSNGQRYTHINITLLDDSKPEDDLDFYVKLVNVEGGANLGIGSTIRVVIANSDDAYGVFQFNLQSLNLLAMEHQYDIANYTLTVTRLGGLIGAATVTWQINNEASDFIHENGSVSFAEGQNEGDLYLAIRPDVMAELDESSTVSLTGSTAGRLGEQQYLSSQITILANDDPYGVFTIPADFRPVITEEHRSDVNVTVLRSGGLIGQVIVTYRTVAPNASSEYFPGVLNHAEHSDYIQSSGELTFADGETEKTFVVTLQDDDIPEPDESLFAQITTARLVDGGQDRRLADSPKLGDFSATFAEIVISANDNANGILVLSAASVVVAEDRSEPLVYVERTAGNYGEVSVKFEVIEGTATASLDYVYSSTNVVLMDGETRKQLPVRLVNDNFPEVVESFTIRLIEYVTGGATLGQLTQCVVTIQPSDDPQGAFEFSLAGRTVEEPEDRPGEINIRVNRLGGTMNIVAVQWTAMAQDGSIASEDIEPSFGTIYFTSNQASQDIAITIKSDELPEDTEVITLNLTHATNGGRVGRNHLFTLRIPANDNPHGSVGFVAPEVLLLEQQEESVQYINVTRRGGLFGNLMVHYETQIVDLLTLAASIREDDNTWFYEGPYTGHRQASGEFLDLRSQAHPLLACSDACLQERTCQSFEFNHSSLICTWYTDSVSSDELDDSPTAYYTKFIPRVNNLYNSQAQPGSDYVSVQSGSIILPSGSNTAAIPITILPDLHPELNEKFHVILKRVDLVNKTADSASNLPTLTEQNVATAIIQYNDDANGVFKIYSSDPRATDDGQTIAVEEKDHFSLQLVVERLGGTIGDVTVTWTINDLLSDADRETDYVADGATLNFLSGDSVNVITIGIQDDDISEMSESFIVELINPEGGAMLGAKNRVEVIILANDKVAGVLGFTSSSYITREGGQVDISVNRTLPARGIVDVMWEIVGVNDFVASQGFMQTEGMLRFAEGERSQVFTLQVLNDDTPEVNEEYQILLKNVSTQGVPSTGEAELDPQSYAASITVEGSNDPHGIFGFASSSLNLITSENDARPYLVVDRKFGSIGDVRLSYDVMAGHLTDLPEERLEASSGEDFVSGSFYIDIMDAEKSGRIYLNITDDAVPEVEEVFIVNITGVTLMDDSSSNFYPALADSDTTTEVFIIANDGTRGQMEFSDKYRIVNTNESMRTITVPISRVFGTYGTVSVFIYSQTSDSAMLGEDYEFTARELIFGPGQSVQAVNVTILDDELPEPLESFELILASPEGGVMLGEAKTCKIIIAENDGSGGVIEFKSTADIILQEEFTPGGAPIAVDLELIRGPGTFGVISLLYHVTDLNGVESTDLTPSSGTVRFENLQSSAVISLSVINDDISEVMENFTVSLSAEFDSLVGEAQMRNISVLASDSPYGIVSIYLGGSDNSSITVEETNSVPIMLEVRRSKGVLGTIGVDVITEGITATAALGDTLFMSQLQTFSFETSGYCTIGDSMLLVLNSASIPQFTSSIGSDGESSSQSSSSQSQLYRWDGLYTHNANIETNSAIKCMALQTLGVQYFIIINEGIGESTETLTRLYTITDRQVELIQQISTYGAIDAALYTSEDQTYFSILTTMNELQEEDHQVKTYTLQGGQLRRSAQFSVTDSQKLATVTDSGIVYTLVVSTASLTVHTAQGADWILIQTIEIAGITDSILFTYNGDMVMVVVTTDMLVIYQYEEGNFVLSTQHQLIGVHSVNSFYLEGRQLLVTKTANASIVLMWTGTSLQSVWSDASTDNLLIPLSTPQNFGSEILIGQTGSVGSIILPLYLHRPDFVPRTVTLTFDEGETSKSIALSVLDDSEPEGNEYFFATLSAASGGVDIGEDNSVTVNILANDDAHGIISFSPDSLERRVEEAAVDTLIQLNVERLAGTFGRVSVSWVASGNFTTNDIAPTEGLLSFAAGQSVATLTLTLKADGEAEMDEEFVIMLTDVVESGSPLKDRGVKIGSDFAARITVLSNESPHGVLKWERTNVVVAEPEGADTTVNLAILREQGTDGSIQVTYITSRDVLSSDEKQALPGQDYISKQDNIIIGSGQSRASLEVTIKSDDLPETEEQFLVTITSVSLIGSSDTDSQPSIRRPGDVVTVMIAENDYARGIIEMDVERNNEGRLDAHEIAGQDNSLQFKLVRSVGFFGEVGVLWQVLPREATTDDMSPVSGTVTFDPGQSEGFISIDILDDEFPEPIEMFDVQLLSATGGATLGTFRSVRVAILKNDSPSGMFGFKDLLYTVRESRQSVPGSDAERSAEIDVLRMQGVQGTVNVQWQLSEDAEADFELPHSGFLTFEPGQINSTFTLTAKNDGLLEGEERFTVSLISVDSNADLSSNARDAEIVIAANDGASGHIEVVQDYLTVVVGEPTDTYDGKAVIALTRGIGTYGEVTVTWTIIPLDAQAFDSSEGEITFIDGQQTVEVRLQTKDDIQPEERTALMFQVTSATGGATVSPDNSKATVIFAASDYPYGMFQFDSTVPVETTEDGAQITLAIIRSNGMIGQVRVYYTTSPGSANRDDYMENTGYVTFSSGQSQQTVVIRILQDDIPEGPEIFYVNLTSAALESPTTANFTLVNGISLDLPPFIGLGSFKPVIIKKNDNAEGVLQFAQSSVVVKEADNVASLQVERSSGNYGEVGVNFIVISGTAMSGSDYQIENGELLFDGSVTVMMVNISIVDDELREGAEYFDVQLTATTGGALLGSRTQSRVTVAKSDYPNGRFAFEGQLIRTVANPVEQFTVDLIVSRSDGLSGNQELTWRILGPNDITPLQATSDVAHVDDQGREITQGTLTWNDGVGGDMDINILIKAFSGWEVQKTFTIEIFDVQNDVDPLENGEIDNEAATVTLIVLKNGDPNGIIQISSVSLQEQEFVEPETGHREKTFYLERMEGNLGDQEVVWDIIGGSNDVEPSSGSTVMEAGRSTAMIRFSIVADDVPELKETFTLQLRDVIGGATIKTNMSRTTFSILANDDPHGVFVLDSELQRAIVDPLTLDRKVRVNVTRNGGAVGAVRATFDITHSVQNSGFASSHSATFADDEKEAIVDVPLSGNIFLDIDSIFTIRLTAVTYIGGLDISAYPRLGSSATAVLSVPEVAANSYVGFAFPYLNIDELSMSGTVVMSRRGLYGNVDATWVQGYPVEEQPVGFSRGSLSPSFGQANFVHGEAEVSFSVSLVQPSTMPSQPSLYSLYISASSFSQSPTDAKLESSRQLLEIEPYGVIGFSTTQVETEEHEGSVNLVLQRLYGSKDSIQVTYSMSAFSATPGSDYEHVDTLSVIFTAGQKEAIITIRINIDSESEEDEHFMIELISVVRLSTTISTTVSPRISAIERTCNVTILANGDPNGLMDLNVFPTRISEMGTKVTVTVRRNAGTFGRVSVRIRTVGGGEPWDDQIALIPKTQSSNTVSEALSNRDMRLASTAASDYMILNEVIVFDSDDVEKEVEIRILNDDMPESDEIVYVYLTDPTGGARIAEGASDGKKYGFTSFQIIRNDDWNGEIGFTQSSLQAFIDEDAGGIVVLDVIRENHAIFTYDTTVQWEAILTDNPMNDLKATNGIVICSSLSSLCTFTLELVADEQPEFGYNFTVRLFNPSAGSSINLARSSTVISVLPSDDPHGRIKMAKPYTVIMNTDTVVRVQVNREQGLNSRVTVSYATEKIPAEDYYLAGVKVYSALDGVDYSHSTGILVFEEGVSSEFIEISLTPGGGLAAEAYPRVFSIILSNPRSGAVLSEDVQSVVMIVEPNNLPIWETQIAVVTQEMDDETIENLLNDLTNQDQSQYDADGRNILEHILNMIIAEAEKRPISQRARDQLIQIFCNLMNPDIAITQRRYVLVELYERFIFTLMVGETCETQRDPYPGQSCEHSRFAVVKMYPYNINNYQYSSRNKDTIKLPATILPTTDNKTCGYAQYIEYSTDQWYERAADDLPTLLNNRILAVNVRDSQSRSVTASDNAVVSFRIYTQDGRRTHKRAECVYYDNGVWTSGQGTCKVKNELQLGTSTYVDCECSHMSSYAVISRIRDSLKIGYPYWIYIVGGFCMTGLLLSLITYSICCAIYTFSVKLIMHLIFSTFATLACYMLSIWLSSEDESPHWILRDLVNDPSCIVMGAFLHYFLLAQFIWMLIQSINLWRIFTKNDEHTDRFYCAYLCAGYLTPAVFVAVFYGITAVFYQRNGLDIKTIYGDVNSEGEMCFIENGYTALCGVVAPVVVCGLGVLIFMAEPACGCISKQWQSFDDIYTNQSNKGELLALTALWVLISATSLFGGLHMAFNYLWMLIIFSFFLAALGLFAFVYLLCLRGPCSMWIKSSEKDKIPSINYPSQVLINDNGSAMQHYSTSDIHAMKSADERSWAPETVEVPFNSTVIKGHPYVERNSLSRRSELPHGGEYDDDDDDTRDLGELILALKEGRTSDANDYSNQGLSTSDDEYSDNTASRDGNYDLLRRISVGDTHL